MKDIIADANLVAPCGLYCGACRSYLKDRCPGCHENARATWCRVRTCCLTEGYASCADCRPFAEPMDCRKFNSLLSKLFGFLFHSDRDACIRQIKQIGLAGHAEKMAAGKCQTIRK
jgi:hypothetical protein